MKRSGYPVAKSVHENQRDLGSVRTGAVTLKAGSLQLSGIHA